MNTTQSLAENLIFEQFSKNEFQVTILTSNDAIAPSHLPVHITQLVKLFEFDII